MAVSHQESTDTTLNALLDALQTQGYRLVVARDFDPTAAWDKADVDAILILENSTPTSAFVEWQARVVRPLVVLLAADDASEPLETAADFVYNLQQPYLTKQLSRLLSKHRQHLAAETKAHLYDAQRDQQKQLNNEVELLKNAIVRNVSHELKTPLLQLKAAIALISDTVNTIPESDKKLVTYAENATARLELIIQNITLLGNSLDVAPSPIILRDVVEHVKRTMRRIWERKNDIDRIELQTQPALPPVYADKQGLSTVLQLLIDNALKFSDGKVLVTARQQGSHIVIEVRDTGIGISSEKIHHIFDMFYQVDSSSTRRYGGMGIGLSIVKLILDRHQSEITVNSEEGKGSVFSFTMPLFDIKTNGSTKPDHSTEPAER